MGGNIMIENHFFNKEALSKFNGGIVSIITNDGRQIVGILCGFDQMTNIVIKQCHERIYQPKNAVEMIELGVLVVRGDNIAIIGDLDHELETNNDLSKMYQKP